MKFNRHSHLRKTERQILIVCLFLSTLCQGARANDAERTAIRINRDTAGPTPFIRFVDLTVSDLSSLSSVQFSIAPKAGSITHPISATYPTSYLDAKGYVAASSGEVLLPVFGLYADSTNDVTLTYLFDDGSMSTTNIQLITNAFSDPCGFSRPNVIQPRDPNTSLTYDFILVKNACGSYAPTVLDTDGEIRWVGTAGSASVSLIGYDNSFYLAPLGTPRLVKIELDGVVNNVADYSSLGFTFIHHTIEHGKRGILFQTNSTGHDGSIVAETDPQGNILKTWDMVDILSHVMTQGGDDPAEFVRPSEDWFHSNAMTYRSSDDSLLVSSRENFVIALDYESGAVKWILGDPTKSWASFPSLARFALALTSGSLPPIGQHAISITGDDQLLLFDNGTASLNHSPAGASRTFSAARRYVLDLGGREASEVWRYDDGQSLYSAYCSSVYEDGVDESLLLDYAYIVNLGTNQYAELVGLTPDSRKVFEYRYPTASCDEAFNSEPLHWENIVYPLISAPPPGTTPTPTPAPAPSPTVTPVPTATPIPSASPSPTVAPTVTPSPTPPDIRLPAPLVNVSSRGIVRQGDDVMIGGFIISGQQPKRVVIRGLGPSLAKAGLTNAISDPILELHDSSRVIATNDNFVSSDELGAYGLEPTDPRESAFALTLAPGAYTAVLRDKNGQSGLGLVEIYDVDPSSSRIGNLSTRARVEAGDNVLIGGFIIHDGPAKILVRALGPSLQAHGVTHVLQDPMITIYNANGSVLAENESWQSSQGADIAAFNLAPSNSREAAVIVTVANGSYTAVVTNQLNAPDSDGVGLVEIYYLTEP